MLFGLKMMSIIRGTNLSGNVFVYENYVIYSNRIF